MNCKNCGAELNENAVFCTVCGTAVEQPAPVAEPQPKESVYGFPEPTAKKPFTENDLPEEYRPLSPWSYFWLQILFAVPIVGFVFLIIFSFKRSNLNRRNFARSYWIWWILAAALSVIAVVLVLILRVGAAKSVGVML